MLARQATKAVDIGLTLRNWFVGFRTAELERQGTDPAGDGDLPIPELAATQKAQNIGGTGRRHFHACPAFRRAYPQTMRTAPAQGNDLSPSAVREGEVRALSALSAPEPAIDPEKLLSRIPYSHFEQLPDLDDPPKRRFYEIEALRGSWSARTAASDRLPTLRAH